MKTDNVHRIIIFMYWKYWAIPVPNWDSSSKSQLSLNFSFFDDRLQQGQTSNLLGVIFPTSLAFAWSFDISMSGGILKGLYYIFYIALSSANSLFFRFISYIFYIRFSKLSNLFYNK